MKYIVAGLLFIICSVFLPCSIYGQKGSANFLEPGYQLTPLLGGAGSFLELEAGKQFPGGVSLGGVIHFLISDIERSSGNRSEQISSLWYAGPRIQYVHRLNRDIALFGGSTFGIGTSNYQTTEFDHSSSGGFLIAVRTEAGVRFTLPKKLQINVGANLFYTRLNTGQTVTGIPALRIGLRLGG
ncbi:MAG: hypothetical protein JJU37_05780 [Balneolaceae bacterium]|nr:hypothetical protein [Balneolaceae bacterium]